MEKICLPALLLFSYDGSYKHQLDRLANAGKYMLSILFPYCLQQWSIPTLLFKFIIFKLFLQYILLQYYHKLQQLITYGIAMYKQQIKLPEAGKSQGKYLSSLVELFTLSLIHHITSKTLTGIKNIPCSKLTNYFSSTKHPKCYHYWKYQLNYISTNYACFLFVVMFYTNLGCKAT